MPNITSQEINYLIYRYLLESGYSHSSFTFTQESNILKQEIKGSLIPPGALVRYLQKGLLYNQVEQHILKDGTSIKCIAPFTLLGKHECEIPEDDEIFEQYNMAENAHVPIISENISTNASHSSVDVIMQDIQPNDSLQEIPSTPFPDSKLPFSPTSSPPTSNNQSKQSNDFQTLIGHAAEVFVCAWNPSDSLLATGSGDGTARIWNINPNHDSKPIILPHAPQDSPNRDVTTLDWHPQGDILATGSYEGIARIWNKKGQLKNILKKHTGPIFALKWNKKGDVLLTISVDKTAIVWDPSSGEVRQQFEFHTAPCLDVDWKDDTTFATCSNDKQIFVCQLGSLSPLVQFSGHKGEVNSIRWDPSGTYLASCSDDFTVKIWTMDSDSPKCDFTGHEKEIYTIRWNPHHPTRKWIATGSFDFSVRVFDVLAETCVYKFDHLEAVYTVCFSPDSLYLASGSFDTTFQIHDMKDGELVKSVNADNGGVFEVAWAHKGDQLAICYSNSTVLVVPFDN